MVNIISFFKSCIHFYLQKADKNYILFDAHARLLKENILKM